MNLLLLTTSYPDSGRNGAAAAGMFVADFARALVEQGNQVTVVAPAKLQSYKSEYDIYIHRFAVPHLPLSLLKPQNPMHWQSIIKTLWAGQQAAHQACVGGKFDHILAMWVLPSGEWARRAGRQYGIPYSTWALGSDIWSLSKIPILRRLLKKVLQEAVHSYADGIELAEDVERLSDRSCSFLPSSRRLDFPQTRIYRQQPPYRIAFLGRWHHNKGIDLLMQALNLLNEDDWGKIEQIRICGGGPLEEKVKKAGTKLKRQSYPVDIGGYLNQDQAKRLLTWADYLVIPSRIESIPVIFSDAMQAGCPVIAAPVGDLPRLVAREPACGLIANAASAESIASLISQALDRTPLAFAAGLRTMSATFDLSNTIRQLLQQISSPPND